MARRSLKSRLLLLGVSAVLALLAAEAVFRGFGPRIGGFGPGAFYTPNGVKVPVAEIANFLGGGGYMGATGLEPPYGRLTPSLEVKQGYDQPRWPYFDAEGCILVRHNSRGFRDEEFPIAKPTGEFRVLALGDSFTWGSGVLAEDSWPQVLERHLRAHGPAQVVNCGFACGSYNPIGYDAWMQSDGLLLHPDLVIVGFCLNDMETKANDVPMLSYQTPRPVSYPSKLLEYAIWTYECRAARLQTQDYAQVVRDNPVVWNGVQAALRNLKKICDDAGIKLVVAIFPMLSQLDFEPYPYAGLITMVQDFCGEAGIAWIDTSPLFVGRSDEIDLWVHPTDQHPNHVAQRMLGDVIFKVSQAKGLLPR